MKPEVNCSLLQLWHFLVECTGTRFCSPFV